MRTKPVVSVIMAAYNASEFIDLSIQSVLNQSFGNFELLIINDASIDNTLEIIKKYAKADSRIKIFNNKRNLGQTTSRNKALKEAKGKYIAIMDADDICLSDRFDIQTEFLENRTDIFLIGGAVELIDSEGSVLSTPQFLISEKEIFEYLTNRGNCLFHPTIMFRSENYFYRDKFRYAEDYDFYLVLLSEGKKVMNIEKVLLQYRISTTGIGRSKKGIEGLFAEKARTFYAQRQAKGLDDYDLFNTKEILEIDIDNTINKVILRSEALASFEKNDLARGRNFCKRYFKNYGILNRLVVYYLLSFVGLHKLLIRKDMY